LSIGILDQKAITPLAKQWLMKYQETKYKPQSRKADRMAARGELRDWNILSSVRIASPCYLSKIQL
jgi:hypothetical protein